MAHYDQATVERVIEEVTREVLLRLAAPESQGTSCNCDDGTCAEHCTKQVDQVVQAGADRLSATLGTRPHRSDVGRLIDHTLLKADASQDQIAQLCYEARTHQFASVCVNPAHVKLSAQLLKDSGVPVCTVVGFPLGATPGTVKAFETQQAIRDGAREIDMVINIGALKSQDYSAVYRDIAAVVRAAPPWFDRQVPSTAIGCSNFSWTRLLMRSCTSGTQRPSGSSGCRAWATGL